MGNTIVCAVEEWRQINGFPDYEVSNSGRIRDVDTWRYIKSRTFGFGKRQVTLHNDDGPHTKMVDDLVAAVFADELPTEKCFESLSSCVAEIGGNGPGLRYALNHSEVNVYKGHVVRYIDES
jgi:hypothetical protein